MAYYRKGYKKYAGDKRIMKTSDGKVAFTATVVPEGIEPNEEGRLLVPIGTPIDVNGQICTWTGSDFDNTPVGITDYTVDVTFGNETVARIEEGWFFGEALNWGEDVEYSQEIYEKMKEYLPFCHMEPPETFEDDEDLVSPPSARIQVQEPNSKYTVLFDNLGVYDAEVKLVDGSSDVEATEDNYKITNTKNVYTVEIIKLSKKTYTLEARAVKDTVKKVLKKETITISGD